MTEKHIPDTLNSIEIRNKFNSQYKFLKNKILVYASADKWWLLCKNEKFYDC